MTIDRARTPWHLWVVGVLSLLWNAFGANDYTQTQLGNRDYIASAMRPMGVSIDEALAYFNAFPAWMDTAWALGVWGSVLGSILLLLRKSLAVLAFFVSLFGLFVTTLYDIGNPMPGVVNGAGSIALLVGLWVILVSLIVYSRTMVKRNHLR